MAAKSVAQKAGVKPGATVAVVNAVPGIVESLGLPDDITFVEPDRAGIVLLFAGTRAELESLMVPAVEAMAPGAAVWVFFRRGSRAAGLDMNRDSVWEIAETLGMRPLGLLRVDDTWSVFRLRRAQVDSDA